MKASMLLIVCSFMMAVSAHAATSNEKRLFTLEKSVNSENILNIVTTTDENCKFVSATNGYVDFYWLMNKTTLKQVHPMIRSTVQERVKFTGINSRRDVFTVQLNDLSEIRHDLESSTIEARAEINNGKCEVKSVIQLGASSKYKKMNLQRTYCEVTTNLIGIPSGCSTLELSGTDNATGEKLTVKFKGK